MPEDDTRRFDRPGGEPPERDHSAGRERLHHLARFAVQKAVEGIDGTEPAHGLALVSNGLDVQTFVEQRRIPREAVERTMRRSATQDHVADDAESTGVVGLGGVQTKVGIASELLTESPQPLHDVGGNTRVGTIEEMRVDAGRRAYVGAWMTLALEEAKKINNQRRCERSVAFHALESTVNSQVGRRRIVIGGISLIVATVLFAAVFIYLASAFDYPAVLERPASEVLPRLLSLGATGRLVWLLYGVIPLLLIPTALGVNEAVRRTMPSLGRISLWLAAISALAMMTGLLRWPTLQWSLAEAWPSASDITREAIAARFAGANLYLGNVVGEFIGELSLNAFFLVASLALARQPRLAWLRWFGLAAGALGWTAMLRNITPAVSTIASINNSVLPLWMLALGGALIFTASRRSDQAPG